MLFNIKSKCTVIKYRDKLVFILIVHNKDTDCFASLAMT